MIELGINIDHVATLRQQRLTTYPDPLQAAVQAEYAGADLITLHLREDRRHIQDHDVYLIKDQINTRMNLECAITDEMINIACQVIPHDVCLVPEQRHELTTEGGLDVATQRDLVSSAVKRLQDKGIRVSLFIDAEESQIEVAHQVGADAIELHTGVYAEFAENNNAVGIKTELARLKTAIQLGLQAGLRVNAGHGLHYDNVRAIAELPGISELNVGHAVVAYALFEGWGKAVRDMKALIVSASQRTFL